MSHRPFDSLGAFARVAFPLTVVTLALASATLLGVPQALAATCTSALSPVKTPTVPGLLENRLAAVAADAPTDVWAAGADGRSAPLVERFDGTTWSVVPTPQLFNGETDLLAAAPLSPSDVWLGGTGASYPVIMHWNGTSWGYGEFSQFARHGSVNGFSASAANDLWAVGYGYTNADRTDVPTIAHYDGSTWTGVPADPSVTEGSFSAVTAISGADAWAVGSDPSGELIEHWNGSAWRVIPDPGTSATDALTAVTATSSNNVWAVGRTGSSPARTLAEHYDGASWSVVESPSPNAGGDSLSGVLGLSGSDAWAVGTGGATSKSRPLIEHWNGSGWTVKATTLPSPGSLGGIARDPSGGVWAVGTFDQPFSLIGRTLVARLDTGGTWSQGTSPNVDDPSTTPTFLGIEATSSTDAWVVGFTAGPGGPLEPVAEHWDGSRWSSVPTPDLVGRFFNDVAATSASNVWAVGGTLDPETYFPHALIEHYDGTGWSRVRVPSRGIAQLGGVSADQPDDAWAIGGAILHWDGSTWRRVRVPIVTSDTTVSQVLARSPTDVWLVGYRQMSPTLSKPFVGHFDGATWTKVSIPHPAGTSFLSGLAPDRGGGLWAVGTRYATPPTSQPFAVHESGGIWTKASPPPVADSAGPGTGLGSVAAVSPSDVWAVGSEQLPTATHALVEHWDGSSWSEVTVPGAAPYPSEVVALPDGDLWVAQWGTRSLLHACGA